MIVPSVYDEMDLFPLFSFDHTMIDSKVAELEKKLFGHRAKNMMSTDIKENDSAYEMQVDLPGFKKDEVSVVLKNGYLTVSAAKECENDEPEPEREDSECRYLHRERCSGSCSRSYYVGEQYEKEDVSAKFKHGILTLSLPKKGKNELCKKDCIEIED